MPDTDTDTDTDILSPMSLSAPRRIRSALSERATRALDQVAPGAHRVLWRLARWDDAARTRWPVSAIVGPDIDRSEVEGDGSRLLWRPAILGVVALTAIALGCAQPASPFVLKITRAWFYGISSSSNTADSTHGLLLGLVEVYGGLLLLMRVWISLARTLSRVHGVPVKKLALVFAAWIVPVLIAPPLFSRDIYSYAAQGEMVTRHISPYLYGPNTLGLYSVYQRLVDPLWGNSPAPYGPLIMQLDGLAARLSLHNELATVVLERLLALAGVVMIAVGIPAIAKSFGRDPSEAFVLAVLNPVTILHLVGGAHNDALMVGLLVMGVAVARRGRPVLGIVLCALSAAVKVPGAIGIVYIAWNWTGYNLSLRERIRPLVTAGIIGAAVMGFLSLESGLGWGWVNSLASPGTVTSWLAPATGIGIVLEHVSMVLGLGSHQAEIMWCCRTTGLLAAAVSAVWFLLNSDRLGWLRAMGMTLLAVAVFGPVLQPWYLAWGLVLVVPVATGKVRTVLLAFSVASGFIQLPGGRDLVTNLVSQNPLWIAVALLACLFILTVPLTPVRPAGREARLMAAAS